MGDEFVAAMMSSVSSEWMTPEKYTEAARRVMGSIDLDPASSDLANTRVKAKQYYTIADNGLTRPWDAKNVFLNPPYGFLDAQRNPWAVGSEGKVSSVEIWVDKLLREFTAGRITRAILLVNNTTEASWFQDLWQFPICFPDHRIKFDTPSGAKAVSPTKGNAFVYICDERENAADFVRAFGQFGHCQYGGID